MADTIYWIARSALVLAWLGVAWTAWRWLCRVGRIVGLWAVTIASMRAWPWNYEVHALAQRLMRAAGIYEDRIWGKIALGVLLAGAVALAAVRLRSVRDPAIATVLLGLGLQTALLAIETFSIEAILPAVLVRQPGRYLLEGSFALCALMAALGARHSARARAGAACGRTDRDTGEVA